MSEKAFSIWVGGLSSPSAFISSSQLCVRISLVDRATGNLVEKVVRTSHALSQHEDTPFIPPACTKAIATESEKFSALKWNSEILYSEPVSTVMNAQTEIFFEIIDFLHHGHGKSLDILPLAWGFLRLRDIKGNLMNLGVLRWIELNSYPKDFSPTIQNAKLPVFSLKPSPLDLRLSVLIKGAAQQPITEVKTRPASVFESEVAPPLSSSDSSSSIASFNVKVPIPTKLFAQIYCGDSGALCLRYSHSGETLAVACQQGRDFEVQLYSSRTMSLFKRFLAHFDLIYDMDYSADDSLILTASADGTTKVWSPSERDSSVSSFTTVTYVYSAKFHPRDSNIVVSAGSDSIIRVWSRSGGCLMKELKGHKTRINTIVFAPSGSTLFSGDANGEIILWNSEIKNGSASYETTRTIQDCEIYGSAIVFMTMPAGNDHSLLVQTQDNHVRIVDTTSCAVTQRYVGSRCEHYKMESAFSILSSYVIAGSEDGSVYAWSSKNTEMIPVIQWRRKFDYPVSTVAWNQRINQVAFSSFGIGQPLIVFFDNHEEELMRELSEMISEDESEVGLISIDESTSFEEAIKIKQDKIGSSEEEEKMSDIH